MANVLLTDVPLREYLDGKRDEEHEHFIKQISDLLETEHNNYCTMFRENFDLNNSSIIPEQQLVIGNALVQNEGHFVDHLLQNIYSSGRDLSAEAQCTQLRIVVMLLHLLDCEELSTNNLLMDKLKTHFLEDVEPTRSYALWILTALIISSGLNMDSLSEFRSMIPTVFQRLKYLKEATDYEQPAIQEVENIPERSTLVRLKRRKQHSKLVSNSQIASNSVPSCFYLSYFNVFTATNTSISSLNDSAGVEDTPQFDISSKLNQSKFKNFPYTINPVNIALQQRILIDFLKSFKYDQSDMNMLMNLNVLDVIFFYTNPRKNQNDTLAFHALLLLDGLMSFRKVARTFFCLGGIQKILRVPCESHAAIGVSKCLNTLVVNCDILFMLNSINESVIEESVQYSLSLISKGIYISKIDIPFFLTKMIKSLSFLRNFDKSNGIETIIKFLSALSIVNPSIATLIDDTRLKLERMLLKSCSFLLKTYVESHVALLYENSIKKSSGSSNAIIDTSDIEEKIDAIFMQSSRFCCEPIKRFVNSGGLRVLIRIIYTCRKLWRQNNASIEAVRNIMDAICAITVIPTSLPYFCEKFDLEECKSFVLMITSMLDITKNNTGASPVPFLRFICYCIEPFAPEDSFSTVTRMKRQLRETFINAGVLWKIIKIFENTSTNSDGVQIRAFSVRCLYSFINDPQFINMISMHEFFSSGKLFQVVNNILANHGEGFYYRSFVKYAFLLMETLFERNPANFFQSFVPIKSSLHYNHIIPNIQDKLRSKMEITYPKNELLHLIHNYLKKEYPKTASELLSEANEELLTEENLQKNSICTFSHSQNGSFQTHQISLDEIIKRYLSEQHLKCAKPFNVCPPFSLLSPHKCSEPSKYNGAPYSNVARFEKMRESMMPFGGLNGRKYTTHFFYRNYLSMPYLICDSMEEGMAQCAVLFNSDAVAVGDSEGYLSLFKLDGELISQVSTSDSAIVELSLNRDCNKLIASSAPFYNSHTLIWDMSNLNVPNELYQFFNVNHACFSHDDMKFITTEEFQAVIYDMESGNAINKYPGSIEVESMRYRNNKASFNSTDEMILNDCLLYDVRSEVSIHQFPRLGPLVYAQFAPSDLDVLIGSEIWDLRTMKLRKTVSKLEDSVHFFTKHQELEGMFSVKFSQRPARKPNSKFPIFSGIIDVSDAFDYSSIKTLDLKTDLHYFSISYDNRYLVLTQKSHPRPPDGYIEDHLTFGSTVVKLYEIGSKEISIASDALNIDSMEEFEENDEENTSQSETVFSIASMDSSLEIVGSSIDEDDMDSMGEDDSLSESSYTNESGPEGDSAAEDSGENEHDSGQSSHTGNEPESELASQNPEDSLADNAEQPSQNLDISSFEIEESNNSRSESLSAGDADNDDDDEEFNTSEEEQLLQALRIAAAIPYRLRRRRHIRNRTRRNRRNRRQ